MILTRMDNPLDPELQSQGWLIRLANRPWKIAALSVSGSLLVATGISLLVAGPDAVLISYAIGGPTALLVSYIASRLIYRYLRVIEQKNEELRQLNRDLDAFARTVAHDLKNPLAAIAGYANFLRDGYETMDRDDWRECLESIEQSSQHASDIVDALLLLAKARQETVDSAPLDMAQIVGQAWARQQWLIDQYHPDLTLPDTWPSARGVAAWVEAVWSNYLSNAIKYGGRPPRVQIGADIGGGCVRYWVRDNGGGLSADEQAQLFQEFSPLAHGEGYGLGLSIARRVIERLGGNVGVISQPGQGSEFYFTLPLAVALPPESQERL
jgi:signal transduction histidine kinase